MSDEDREWLELAREWKAGRLTSVHPTVGRFLNLALSQAGEDCVPFRAATDIRAPTMAALVRREHTRAQTPRLVCRGDAVAELFASTEQGRADVG